MSGRPPVTSDSDVLVHTAQAGDPRRIAAVEPPRTAAGGRCVLAVRAPGGSSFAAPRKRRRSAVFPPPAAAPAPAVVAGTGAGAGVRFSHRDALPLAAAAEAGCAAAIPGDMGGGAALGTTRVVPAFAGDGGVGPAARAALP